MYVQQYQCYSYVYLKLQLQRNPSTGFNGKATSVNIIIIKCITSQLGFCSSLHQ